MGYSKTLIVCFFTFALLIHSSQAQDSPQDYLDAHNEARKQVGVGPMTWDYKLEAYAQNYANQRIGDCKMQHSHGPYGENLAAGYPQLHAAGAVRMWVKENQWYDYNSNTCVPGKVCGHYTQVVWRKSIRLGCARVKCNNRWYFITCNYDPPGNYVGQRPYGDLDGQPTFDSKLELLNDVY